MSENSIFISQNEIDDDDISGKLTYTNILETIPNSKLETPIVEWQKNHKTEWRWRFLKFDNRHVAEISYVDRIANKRLYFNKHGEWVERVVSPVYDPYVDKIYYVYTN